MPVKIFGFNDFNVSTVQSLYSKSVAAVRGEFFYSLAPNSMFALVLILTRIAPLLYPCGTRGRERGGEGGLIYEIFAAVVLEGETNQFYCIFNENAKKRPD